MSVAFTVKSTIHPKGVLMPRLAANDDELLDEAEKHLEILEDLLQKHTTDSLRDARAVIHHVSAALHNCDNRDVQRWKALHARCLECIEAWKTACRHPEIRKELAGLTSADLTASSGEDDEFTLIAFRGSEADGLSGIAVHAFAVSGRRPRGMNVNGQWVCLWGRKPLLDAVVRKWCRAESVRRFPTTAAEAEVAATLWDPSDSTSAYHDLQDAVEAARAILAA